MLLLALQFWHAKQRYEVLGRAEIVFLELIAVLGGCGPRGLVFGPARVAKHVDRLQELIDIHIISEATAWL